MHTVSRFSTTPVKGLGLFHPDEIMLERSGVPDDRRFHLVDDGGRYVNGKRHGPLVQVRAQFDPDRGRLLLCFPDGLRLDGEIDLGEAVETALPVRDVRGRIVHGPWSDALSRHADQRLRLVYNEHAGEGVDVHPVTMLADASVEELSRRAGQPLDARRFRMTVMLAGGRPHEEDQWQGRRVGIGDAVVRVLGPVPRCAVTTHDPESGAKDTDTLGHIKAYRGLREGQAIDFGVYCQVEQPGRVRLGDPVQPEA